MSEKLSEDERECLIEAAWKLYREENGFARWEDIPYAVQLLYLDKAEN